MFLEVLNLLTFCIFPFEKRNSSNGIAYQFLEDIHVYWLFQICVQQNCIGGVMVRKITSSVVD